MKTYFLLMTALVSVLFLVSSTTAFANDQWGRPEGYTFSFGGRSIKLTAYGQDDVHYWFLEDSVFQPIAKVFADSLLKHLGESWTYEVQDIQFAFCFEKLGLDVTSHEERNRDMRPVICSVMKSDREIAQKMARGYICRYGNTVTTMDSSPPSVRWRIGDFVTLTESQAKAAIFCSGDVRVISAGQRYVVANGDSAYVYLRFGKDILTLRSSTIIKIPR